MSKPTFVVTDSMVEIHDIHPSGIVLLKEQVLELFNQVTANQPDWFREMEGGHVVMPRQTFEELLSSYDKQLEALTSDVRKSTVERDEYFAAYKAKREALEQSEFERDMAVHAYTALRTGLVQKEIDTKMGEIREALKDEG